MRNQMFAGITKSKWRRGGIQDLNKAWVYSRMEKKYKSRLQRSILSRKLKLKSLIMFFALYSSFSFFPNV